MEWPGWASAEWFVEMSRLGGADTGWLVLAYLMLVGLVAPFLCHSVRRRRLQCPESGRHVEVEFECCGLPGLRCDRGVRGCSAFDPPAAVACGRRCLRPGLRAT
jgi:hypothetical protein